MEQPIYILKNEHEIFYLKKNKQIKHLNITRNERKKQQKKQNLKVKLNSQMNLKRKERQLRTNTQCELYTVYINTNNQIIKKKKKKNVFYI